MFVKRDFRRSKVLDSHHKLAKLAINQEYSNLSSGD